MLGYGLALFHRSTAILPAEFNNLVSFGFIPFGSSQLWSRARLV